MLTSILQIYNLHSTLILSSKHLRVEVRLRNAITQYSSTILQSYITNIRNIHLQAVIDNKTSHENLKLHDKFPPTLWLQILLLFQKG